MIEARGVTKSFAGRPALRGVDLDAAAGEIVAITGPNGAGKTTLMRILATIARPSAGRVRIAGKELPGGAAAARRRIGFLSHAPLLYPDLTGEENLWFYGRLYGLPDARERAQTALADAGLQGAAHEPVRRYSRGMQQKLALARTMVHEPAVLLLDEPYASLDADGREDWDRRWRQFCAAGGTVLITSHDEARLEGLAHRVLKMSHGRLGQAEGKAAA